MDKSKLDENRIGQNQDWTKAGLDEKLWTKTGWTKTGWTKTGRTIHKGFFLLVQSNFIVVSFK